MSMERRLFLTSLAATLASAAGTYPITPSATGANLANYTVNATNGTLTVTQASPVITWTPASPISYGTPLGAAQLNASVTGSISRKPQRRALSYSGEDDDRLPLAMPGDD